MNIEDATTITDTMFGLIADWRLRFYQSAHREPTQREFFDFLEHLKQGLIEGMRATGLPETDAEERRRMSNDW